ncbi:MAG: TnsA endonuclease N-terminal domain-containing protein [Candidatus Pacearchaeota archaeon]|jgi:hypothetical protein|nr:head completion protein [Clostridia bacterium]
MAKTDIKSIVPSRNVNITGKYVARNPVKYIGDITKIIYRSSWERKFCVFCDSSQKVLKWSSEPFAIQYISPIDKRVHEYFVDFYIKIEQSNGVVEEYLVEVKPKAQLLKPLPPKKNTHKMLMVYNEQLKTFIINTAKFAAAKMHAAKRGCKFLVVTEDFLFNQ